MSFFLLFYVFFLLMSFFGRRVWDRFIIYNFRYALYNEKLQSGEGNKEEKLNYKMKLLEREKEILPHYTQAVWLSLLISLVILLIISLNYL
jgi:hypothetical protein